MTYKISTTSPATSESLGSSLGALLRGGEVIELVSDLGGGKTTFCRGILRGLGYDGPVASPTFTISRVYKLPGGLLFHHFDFYRLHSGDLLEQELADVLSDPKSIVAVEWGSQLPGALPPEKLTINITPIGDESRRFDLLPAGGRYEQLVKELQS